MDSRGSTIKFLLNLVQAKLHSKRKTRVIVCVLEKGLISTGLNLKTKMKDRGKPIITSQTSPDREEKDSFCFSLKHAISVIIYKLCGNSRTVLQKTGSTIMMATSQF